MAANGPVGVVVGSVLTLGFMLLRRGKKKAKSQQEEDSSSSDHQQQQQQQALAQRRGVKGVPELRPFGSPVAAGSLKGSGPPTPTSLRGASDACRPRDQSTLQQQLQVLKSVEEENKR